MYILNELDPWIISTTFASFSHAYIYIYTCMYIYISIICCLYTHVRSTAFVHRETNKCRHFPLWKQPQMRGPYTAISGTPKHHILLHKYFQTVPSFLLIYIYIICLGIYINTAPPKKIEQYSTTISVGIYVSTLLGATIHVYLYI
jgi:hypothetical protein